MKQKKGFTRKNFSKKNFGGFTLIELLVVIAIIGILSSIVLASLSTARTKANDVKTKAQLGGARKAAESYNLSQPAGNYGAAVDGTEAAGASIGPGCDTNIFASSDVSPYTRSSNYPDSPTTGKCTVSGNAFVISVPLTGGATFWCVDSAGHAALTTTNAVQADSADVCP